VPTPEVTTEPAPLSTTATRVQHAGPLMMLIEGICAAIVAAFLLTGSNTVTVTVAVAALASLAIGRKRA
jgi:predicted thioesterase